jgi:hypothetical protein
MTVTVMESLEHQGQHAHRADLSLQSNSAIDEPPMIHREFRWGCCFCGVLSQVSGGMSIFIEQCPNFGCGHLRCQFCSMESVKIREEGFRSLSETSSSNFVNNSRLAPLNRTLTSTSPSQKHGCDSGESDKEEEGNKSKKLRRDAEDDPDCDPGIRSALDTSNFACHFHKRNWRRYSPLADRRYKKCIGSSIPVTALRRIKSVPCSLQSNPRLIPC